MSKKKIQKLRIGYQKPTDTKGGGDWWWSEWKDGIRVCHAVRVQPQTAVAFFSWAMIKGAVARKQSSEIVP